jgi:hypothetical protein
MKKKKNKQKFKFNLKYIPILILFILVLMLLIKNPSNNRDWNKDQQILSSVNFNDNIIQINNIRNIHYRNKTDFDISYYNKTINLEDLETLDYMIEELEGFPGFAHTLLSFGFKDKSQIAISVEIRKEKGEGYHPLTGMLREFELMYVIADEKDVINLRANHRNDTIYLYPIKISKESLDKLFISMLEKTNSLIEKPEFYNTLTSTCTTNLADVADKSTTESFFKFHYKVLLPGFSDELLLDKGLIDTNLTDINEVRDKFNINQKAREYQHKEEFSLGIRNY